MRLRLTKKDRATMKLSAIIIAALLALAPAAADARSHYQSNSRPPASDYQQYRKQVDRLTNHNYRINRAKIDPGNLRGRDRGYDLDHKIPVRVCYQRRVSPEACAAPENLRMLPAHQNRSEGCRGCK